MLCPLIRNFEEDDIKITFLINYNHSDDENSPDWLSLEIKAFSEEEALKKFEGLKRYSSETIITRL